MAGNKRKTAKIAEQPVENEDMDRLLRTSVAVPEDLKKMMKEEEWGSENFLFLAEDTKLKVKRSKAQLRVINNWAFIMNGRSVLLRPNLTEEQLKGVQLIGDVASLNSTAKYIIESGEWEPDYDGIQLEPMIITDLLCVEVRRDGFRGNAPLLRVWTKNYMYYCLWPESFVEEAWNAGLDVWEQKPRKWEAEQLKMEPVDMNCRPAYWRGLESWLAARRWFAASEDAEDRARVDLDHPTAERSRVDDLADDHVTSEEDETPATKKPPPAKQRTPRTPVGRQQRIKVEVAATSGLKAQPHSTRSGRANGGSASGSRRNTSEKQAPGKSTAKSKNTGRTRSSNPTPNHPSQPDTAPPFASTSLPKPCPPTATETSGGVKTRKRKLDDGVATTLPAKRGVRSIIELLDNEQPDPNNTLSHSPTELDASNCPAASTSGSLPASTQDVGNYIDSTQFRSWGDRPLEVLAAAAVGVQSDHYETGSHLTPSVLPVDPLPHKVGLLPGWETRSSPVYDSALGSSPHMEPDNVPYTEAYISRGSQEANQSLSCDSIPIDMEFTKQGPRPHDPESAWQIGITILECQME